MVDVSDKFHLIGDGAIVTSNGAGSGVGFQDIITDLTEPDFWEIDVGPIPTTFTSACCGHLSAMGRH